MPAPSGPDYGAALLAAIADPAKRLDDLQPPADGATWEIPPLPKRPGRSPELREGRPPRRRRGIDNERSRLHFLHTIWHIELSAIDLALLCSLRGPGMPAAFHADQLQVAREEFIHAGLVADYLSERGLPPGSDPVHHRLWDAALLAEDLGEQLVVVPRVLEARGLDVNADLLPRLRPVDPAAHAVCERIYHDEIGHVGIGTRWHRHWCQQQGLDPEQHFLDVVANHRLDEVPSSVPLDRSGRSQAGFSERELAPFA